MSLEPLDYLDTADPEPDFSSQSFYNRGILPVKKIVSSTELATPGMVDNWIDDIEEREGGIPRKSRIKVSLTGKRTGSSDRSHSGLRETLREEKGDNWLEEFETGLSEFGKSSKFGCVSVSDLYPARESRFRQPFEELIDSIDKLYVERPLGIPHYTTGPRDKYELMDEIDEQLGKLFTRGYIGVEDLGGDEVEVYVSREMLDRFESRDENPYTI